MTISFRFYSRVAYEVEENYRANFTAHQVNILSHELLSSHIFSKRFCSNPSKSFCSNPRNSESFLEIRNENTVLLLNEAELMARNIRQSAEALPVNAMKLLKRLICTPFRAKPLRTWTEGAHDRRTCIV